MRKKIVNNNAFAAETVNFLLISENCNLQDGDFVF